MISGLLGLKYASLDFAWRTRDRSVVVMISGPTGLRYKTGLKEMDTISRWKGVNCIFGHTVCWGPSEDQNMTTFSCGAGERNGMVHFLLEVGGSDAGSWGK